MRNSEFRKISPPFFLLFCLVFIITSCKSPNNVTGLWYSDRLPQDIVDGSQPKIGVDGVKHSVLSCKQLRSGDLLYEAQFENPYSDILNAFVATSLDEGERGAIWGFFIVELPPGLVNVSFDTSNLSDVEHDNLFYKTLPKINMHFVEECSIHLLGFKEASEFEIVFPVAYRQFDSTFVLPDVSP